MKNKVLTAVNWLVVVLTLITSCMLDSESDLPIMVLTGCVAYLALFWFVNREVLG